MPFFPCAHAGHPMWQHATKQVSVQLRAQISMQKMEAEPRLGLVYVSAAYGERAADIVALLAQSLPHVQHWVGCVTHSVLGGDMDYGSTGALTVLLPCLDVADYQVFSGMKPWQIEQAHVRPRAVLVHGDGSAALLGQRLERLQQDMQCQQLSGGVCALPGSHAQWAWGGRNAGLMPASIGGGGVQVSGLSGVVWGDEVSCIAVGMQGCRPVGARRTITAIEGCTVLALDGQPALEVLRAEAENAAWDTGESTWSDAHWEAGVVAVMPPDTYLGDGCVSASAQVIRVLGMDLERQAVVLERPVTLGDGLALCQRDELAARNDLRRACAEVWESLTCNVPHVEGAVDAPYGAAAGRSICGAVYIRSQHRLIAARQPQVDAELQMIRHALGPVPLIGFTSSHEIQAGQLQHLSAQLLVFTQPLQALT